MPAQAASETKNQRLFLLREPVAADYGFVRDAFAKNNARKMFGKLLTADARNPETPVCTERQRGQLVALADFVVTASMVQVLSTAEGSPAGFLLTTPHRPVWSYVVFSYRGLGLGAEETIEEEVRRRFGAGATFVFRG